MKDGKSAAANDDTIDDSATRSGPDGDSSGDRHGAMAYKSPNPTPQPGDDVFPDRDRPQPELIVEPHRWAHDPQLMIDEIEKHIRESHGLEPDKALLREVVAFVRDIYEREPRP